MEKQKEVRTRARRF